MNNSTAGIIASSYFNPYYLPNLLAWWDGADPNGNSIIPANASAQATWVDKSPNVHNFTQSTGVQQPVNANSFRNGKNALHFGVSVFNQENSSAIDLTASFSCLFAFYPLVIPAFSYLFNITTVTTPELYVLVQSGNFIVGVDGFGQISAPIAINNFYIGIYTYDVTGNAQLWINGVSQGTTSTSAHSAAGSIGRRVGDSAGNTALYYQGYVGDIILSSGVWNATTLTQLTAWARSKWAV